MNASDQKLVYFYLFTATKYICVSVRHFDKKDYKAVKENHNV